MTLDLNAAGDRRLHYDRTTIMFHWITALLVVLLFGSAWLWNNTPRDWHWHPPLEALHVSFGILFAVVLVARVGWRLWRGRRLQAADAGVAGWASKTLHFALYLLLALQAALGFGLRWMQGETFSFFGLFAIPDPFTPARQIAHFLEPLHNYVGWTIVILAGGHAAAALIHHFLLRDRVLGRMVPAGPAT
jgi:cytochrome b561